MNSLTLTVKVETRGAADEVLVPKHRLALQWFLDNADRLPAKGEKQSLDYDQIFLSWEVTRGGPDGA